MSVCITYISDMGCVICHHKSCHDSDVYDESTLAAKGTITIE